MGDAISESSERINLTTTTASVFEISTLFTVRNQSTSSGGDVSAAIACGTEDAMKAKTVKMDRSKRLISSPYSLLPNTSET